MTALTMPLLRVPLRALQKAASIRVPGVTTTPGTFSVFRGLEEERLILHEQRLKRNDRHLRAVVVP